MGSGETIAEPGQRVIPRLGSCLPRRPRARLRQGRSCRCPGVRWRRRCSASAAPSRALISLVRLARSPTMVVRSDKPSARPASLMSFSALLALRSRPAPSSCVASEVPAADSWLMTKPHSRRTAGEEVAAGHGHLRRQGAHERREQVRSGCQVPVAACADQSLTDSSRTRKPSSAPRP